MLFILAPSKTMDFSPEDLKGNTPTLPEFQKEAGHVAGVIKNTKDMTGLMKVSLVLAKATRKQYEMWGERTKPAIYSYIGDVYKGFYAKTLHKDDVLWAQDHLRIMSGLYGMVRPLDLISGYRLEMKAGLAIDGKKDLYDFWGTRLAEKADQETNDGVICILSSDEYARPITRYSKSRIITPVFFDKKPNGAIGTVPIYSKMMRGVMARWIIDNRIDSIHELQKFSAQGYSYDKVRSTKDRPAFYRDTPAPIVWVKA